MIFVKMKNLLIIIYAAALISACSVEKNSLAKNQVADNKIKNITSTRAYEIIISNKGNPEFSILDVRTPQEYRSGHITDAINIDYYAADFVNKIDNLGKHKKYLVYCRSGSRSGQVKDLMKQKGFSKVYNISNGIIDWQNNKLPIVK